VRIAYINRITASVRIPFRPQGKSDADVLAKLAEAERPAARARNQTDAKLQYQQRWEQLLNLQWDQCAYEKE
jgi:hypothetical protein